MCKPLRLILGRIFARVIAFLKKLHKRQGEYQGSSKAHDRHRKEYDCLKIPEILEECCRKVRKEICANLRAVEGKEDRK